MTRIPGRCSPTVAGLVAVASCAASADAGFLGFVASQRVVGANTVIDIYAGVANASDKFLSVYNLNASTTVAGGFFQQAGLATKAWKPDAAGFTSTRNSIDSFMTAGTYSGGAYGGEFYASANTNGDPLFTAVAGAWNATPGSAPANTIPANAGWFTGDPTSVDNGTESLAGLVGRVNGTGAASATRGIWVAHLVFAGTNVQLGTNVLWSGVGSAKDGVTGHTTSATSSFGAAPPVDSDGDGVPNSTDACPNTPGTCANGCPPNVCGTCGTAPDSDGDGVPNCIDNCPTVANPQQQDCDSDGTGNACEIANGSSDDANGNGIPDECEADCNLNGIADIAEILAGTVPDCNLDQVPDTCQGAVLVDSATGNLGAPSGATPRVHTFAGIPFAESAVQLIIDVRGDLGGTSEWIDVHLNDAAPRRIFGPDGQDCPSTPERATIALTRTEFAALLGQSGSLTVTLACPATVDATECKGSGSIALRLRYLGISPKGDCNGNRRLDICEVQEGVSPDCNANRSPDECDIARGFAADCNGNAVPDSCDISANPALDCNGNGQLDSCELIEGGAAVDCNGNGIIDSCDVAGNPAIDCNGNLLPDSCDIASGRSADVDGNGKPDECQTVRVPLNHPTIQAAIDAAPVSEMRIILVAAGTYAGPVDFLGKPVIVRGADSSDTFIAGTGGQAVSVVRMSNAPQIAALERVTVRGGTSGTPFPGLPQFFVGGGIFARSSAATVRDCRIEQNFAPDGGGAYFADCTTRIERCTIRGNSANAFGGGLVAYGGAVQVSESVIESNQTSGRGGGAYMVSGQPRLLGTVVRANTSSSVCGGVSWVPNGDPAGMLLVEGCTITENFATVAQGGIGITDDGPASKCRIQGSTVCTNSPGPNVAGRWTDLGGNTICDCIADLTFDSVVSGADLAQLLTSWGPCGVPCRADLDGNGSVNGADLALLLAAWGPCGN